MNSIIKKSNESGTLPVKSFSGLVDQLFENNLNRFFDDNFWDISSKNPLTQIPVNVRETDTTFELELVAPGYKKENFKVDISRNLLTVSMEHKEENNQEDKKLGMIRHEYRRQSFSRSFNLDETIDANKIAASYQDGVLHLSLPKKENAQKVSRTISVV